MAGDLDTSTRAPAQSSPIAARTLASPPVSGQRNPMTSRQALGSAASGC
jgi:hypothetical protein